MPITDASFASPNPSAWVQGNRLLRRGISLSHRFFTKVFAGPTPKAEDEIAGYLERHQHDLPPALRIELERRSMSP